MNTVQPHQVLLLSCSFRKNVFMSHKNSSGRTRKNLKSKG